MQDAMARVIFGFEFHLRSCLQKSFRRARLGLLILGLGSTIQAGLIPITPTTAGHYKTDYNTAWNNTSGLGSFSITSVGGTQGILGNRLYRSYLIFDTYDADSVIVSASIQLGVSLWTTSQGVTPTPGTFTGLDMAMPSVYSASQIASNHMSPGDPIGMNIYDDLDSQFLGSVNINSAPNMPGGVSPVVWYTFNLPLSFVSAFNQARTGTARYVTVSLIANNPHFNYIQIAASSGINAPVLTVNSITSVPEPMSFIALGSGLILTGFIRRK